MKVECIISPLERKLSYEVYWTYLLIRQLCSVNTAKRAFTDQIVSTEAPCCYLQIGHRVCSCPDGREVYFLHNRLRIIFVVGLVQLNFWRWFQVHGYNLLQFFSSWWEQDRADGSQFWTATIVQVRQTGNTCMTCWIKFLTSRCHDRLTFDFPGCKRAEMLILFRITSLITPHRFPLDQKEANQCTYNHQWYHNPCNCSTGYFGAFASTATIISIPSSRGTTVMVTMTWSSRRRWSWRSSVRWRYCCSWRKTVAKGVATCPTATTITTTKPFIPKQLGVG